MYISIVVPFFNEQESLVTLFEQINKVCSDNKYEFEIIFIDDGSTDDGAKIVKNIIQQANQHTLISFRKNFGKSSALQTGFKHCKGDFIFTMDADLQDDPCEIPKFIEQLQNGCDIVSGWKYNRLDPLEKRLPSKLFNKTISLLSGVKLHDFNCGFKAYRKEVVEAVDIYGQMHRFIPVIANHFGFKIGEIVVNHRKREFGKSKFGLERYFQGLFDCLTVIFTTKFMDKPMWIFGRISVYVMSVGFIICFVLTIQKLFFGYHLAGRPLLLLGILLLLGGAQLLSIGIIADMIVKTTFRSNYNEKHIKEVVCIKEQG